MALVRSILFVDGENLTFRYQELLGEGKKPRAEVSHLPDVYVWSTFIQRTRLINTDILRINYYTSMVGADDELGKVKNEISQLLFSTGAGDLYGYCQLYPRVYKKLKKSMKSRLVDINIVIDMMRHCYTDAVDVVYLLSGDGDFLNLVEEIARSGKKVCLGAFSSGLDPRLRSAVDRFFSLDDIYFEPTPPAAGAAV